MSSHASKECRATALSQRETPAPAHTLSAKLPLLTRSIVWHCALWQLAVVVDLRCCTCDIAGALTLSPPFPRRLVHAVDSPSHSPNVAVNFNSAPL